MRSAKPRQYCLLKATPKLRDIYNSKNLDGLREYTQRLLAALQAPPDLQNGFKVDAAPSLDWQVRIPNAELTSVQVRNGLKRLVIAYEFDSVYLSKEFFTLVSRNIDKPVAGTEETFLGVGANPGGGVAGGHWCPTPPSGKTFGDRDDARAQIGAQALAGETGDAFVHVWVIDQGFASTHIPPENFGGGIGAHGRLPGSAARTAHGSMVVRNIIDLVPLAAAPNVRLYDFPLIPDRISPNLNELAYIHPGYEFLLWIIEFLKNVQSWEGSWVLANAWAIFNRADEQPPGDYTTNSNHPFNLLIAGAEQQLALDLVFAAGNCGVYCPDARCGALDRGPGRSIWGANAHANVLSVGAVRADDQWIGSSSQGPGPGDLQREKPDLSAPSYFRERLDAHLVNGGTSAACAVAAGVAAALRSNPAWTHQHLSPAMLRQALRDSARSVRGPLWNRRFGHGVLDVKATIAALLATPT